MEDKEKTSPLVSIVINNYNYGRFVGQAIESALAQTYPHVEVIVVDDGSTDDSREVIAQYGERVRAVFKENGGQASAFNVGFAVSKGDPVIFLDADDVLFPNAVEEVVAVWKPELSKVQWRLRLATEDLKPLGATWPGEREMPSGSVRDSLLRFRYYPSPPTSGNAFSRWLLERILPMPEGGYRIAADSYLLTLAGLHGEVRSIDKELGYYRVHGKNFWHTSGWDTQEAKRKLLQQVKVGLQQRNLLEEEAHSLGLPFHPRYTPFAAKTEIALSVLDPGALKALGLSPSRMALALKGIHASLVYPYMPSSFSRIRLSTWFLLVGFLPPLLAKKLVIWGILPSTRPRWLAKFLGASES